MSLFINEQKYFLKRVKGNSFLCGICMIGDDMGVRFDVEKVEEYIKESGLKKGYIINKLNTSTTTFGRWMKEETLIPFVKAVELADILNCNVDDLFIRTD